jgi:hypothetical protein
MHENCSKKNNRVILKLEVCKDCGLILKKWVVEDGAERRISFRGGERVGVEEVRL